MVPVVKSVCLLLVLSQLSGCALGRRSAANDYADARQMWRRGVEALEMGQLGEAEQLLRQAAQKKPDDADAHRHLAETLWRRGSREEALGHVEQACLCAPSDACSAIRAGQMQLSEGDPRRAAEWGERAIGLDARSAEAWALRGRALRRLGETERALADFQQALRYSPNDPELLTDVALLHRARGEHRRSLTALHHLLESYAPGEEPHDALLLAGESYLALGRARDAAETLRLASAKGEMNAELLYRLAEAEAACGQADRAIADARRALRVDSQHRQSQQLLARLLETSQPSQLR